MAKTTGGLRGGGGRNNRSVVKVGDRIVSSAEVTRSGDVIVYTSEVTQVIKTDRGGEAYNTKDKKRVVVKYDGDINNDDAIKEAIYKELKDVKIAKFRID